MKPLPLETLRAALDYEPETGILRWRHRPHIPVQWNTRYADKRAGWVGDDGYVWVRVNGEVYAAHRIAWALAHGEDPAPDEIDHRSGCSTDNRLRNLRRASRALNGVNRAPRGDWPKGVRRARNGKFTAQMSVGRTSKHLGTFLTPEEAHAVYRAAVDARFGAEAYARD